MAAGSHIRSGGLNTRLSRRTVLRGSAIGGAGLAAAALIGCDGGEEAPPAATPAPTATPTPTAEAAATEEAPGDDYFHPDHAGDAIYPYNYPDPSGNPKTGGVIKIGVSWDLGAMDTALQQAGGSTTVPDCTYNSLIGFKHGPDTGSKLTVELEPELAQSWEWSPDGRQVTFNLASGITWQNVPPLNGRGFSSWDVRRWAERQSTTGVNQGAFGLVTDMATPDANTFQFTLSSPSPDFLIPFGTHFMSIYPRELVDQNLLDTRAIGTGPLIITEIEEGSHVILETNPDYWEKNLHGREPWLDGLEFRIMRDSAARIAAYRAGDLDYCYSWPSTPMQAAELLETNPDYMVLADPVVTNSGSWGMNLTDPRFADRRVRQALHLGFNRDLAIQITYYGVGTCLPTAAWPFVYDETPSYKNGLLGPWWTYKPDAARKLLEAAGHEDLEFTVLTTDRYLAAGDAELMQEQFRDIGITVNFNSVDSTEFNSQWVPGAYDEVADGWSTPSSIGAADGFYWEQVHSQSPDNRWYINDPEIDAWADAQRIDLDPETRSDTQRKIFDKLVQEAYRLETIQTLSLSSYPPWLRFVRFNGPYNSYHWFYRWGDSFMDTWLDK